MDKKYDVIPHLSDFCGTRGIKHFRSRQASASQPRILTSFHLGSVVYL